MRDLKPARDPMMRLIFRHAGDECLPRAVRSGRSRAPLHPSRRRPPSVLAIADLVTDAVLDATYAWLCQQRQDWPPGADVWRFRRRWPDEKARLREELLAGSYRIGV